jgi:hypothetical protein
MFIFDLIPFPTILECPGEYFKYKQGGGHRTLGCRYPGAPGGVRGSAVVQGSFLTRIAILGRIHPISRFYFNIFLLPDPKCGGVGHIAFCPCPLNTPPWTPPGSAPACRTRARRAGCRATRSWAGQNRKLVITLARRSKIRRFFF